MSTSLSFVENSVLTQNRQIRVFIRDLFFSSRISLYFFVPCGKFRFNSEPLEAGLYPGPSFFFFFFFFFSFSFSVRISWVLLCPLREIRIQLRTLRGRSISGTCLFGSDFLSLNSLSLAGKSGRLTWVRGSRRKSSAVPILIIVCSIFVRANNGMAASVWVF